MILLLLLKLLRQLLLLNKIRGWPIPLSRAPIEELKCSLAPLIDQTLIRDAASNQHILECLVKHIALLHLLRYTGDNARLIPTNLIRFECGGYSGTGYLLTSHINLRFLDHLDHVCILVTRMDLLLLLLCMS